MRILVVDDDRALAELISFALRREQYEVLQAHSGASALRRWRSDAPDLIVLDVNLPDVLGFALCRSIRAESDTPVILLSACGGEDEIVYGLEIGADDYIVKPFSPRQLAARIGAVLRRAGMPARPEARELGDAKFDPKRRELYFSTGGRISLSSLESRLLDYLLLNAGQVLPFDAIIDHIWGPDGATRGMVRQLIYRLRSKIEPDSADPVHIQTVSGVGYELRPSPPSHTQNYTQNYS